GNHIYGSALAAQLGLAIGRSLKSPGSRPSVHECLPTLRPPEEDPCFSRPNVSGRQPDAKSGFDEQFHAPSCESATVW
ncbi:MAG: hypothetical protein ACRDM0_14200, partial [Thermoleophilaceae bacterium]